MAARVCVECTTVYAVGAPRCPHCGATRHVEQGEPMPKITRHGGPSSRYDSETAGAAADTPAAAAPAPEDEEVPPSPGKSSATSSEKPQPNSKPSEPARRKRARTTANRSKQAPTDNSTAPSTDGDPQAPDAN